MWIFWPEGPDRLSLPENKAGLLTEQVWPITRQVKIYLQVSPCVLLSFQGFKQGLEISLTKTFGPFSLYDLEE